MVPDRRDLDAVHAALPGAIPHSCLSAELGPAERYRRWLAGLRGTATVVAGTRSAMFAPVRNLGLVVLWDDGDDLHAEPRAPYPHAREVLALRAHRAGAAALIGGFARTAEATQLVSAGWAHPLSADRATVRRCAPTITPAGQDRELARDQAARSARVPGLALRTVRDALARGPVLFQVPRRGYLVAVACERCRAPARCGSCGGPLALAGAAAAPVCRWCGRAAPSRVCQHCGHAGLRAIVTGAGRHRGGTRPGLPLGAGAHLGPQRRAARGARRPGRGGGHAGRRAARRARLRRRGPARRLGAARPAQPAGRRGGAAPLDERRRAGPARGRGRRRGRGGRRRAARGAGPGPLGPGHPRRAGAGRTRRAPLPAHRPDGVADRSRARRPAT